MTYITFSIKQSKGSSDDVINDKCLTLYLKPTI